ncbi:MAG TPA: ImcF-related family protein [Candidatus Acidoferrales bacterium]|jgi:type VI secretion system protein ImpL|nr:ImcF-related family protein [Candidatus Acidoferrales bacterium]
MKKIIGISVAGLLVYLAISFFVASLAVPSGNRRWVLIGVLWLLGILAAAAVVWFLSGKNKQKEAAGDADTGEDADEIDALVKAAQMKLTAARAGALGGLPAIFLIGEPGSTKTSTVVHSGIEAELLAGQVYQDTSVVPTSFLNLWLTGGFVIAEFGGKLLANPDMFSRLQRKLQPAKLGSVLGSRDQAPRAALLCCDVETFTQGGAGQAAVSAARGLRQKLGEISEKLGISLPVYVLFTKMDRVPFFIEYVRNLSVDDARQVVGASLSLAPPRPGGYVEQQTGRLNQAFDDLVYSLCDARPELLAREHDAALRPAVYEFPREFRKLRPALVSFLVELCRPSQLTVSPFLRGFYFSGIRPVIVNEAAPAARPADSQQQAPEIAATRMMRVGLHSQPPPPGAQQQFIGSRKVPQWVFLSHLFEHVLLADRIAMGTSGASTKTSMLRRVLLITASAICLILAVGLTVSFFKNRALESAVNQASQASAVAEPTGLNVASLDSLRGLESLRQTLSLLSGYNRNGAPFSYRWGLYVGDDLYPQVYKLYFTRFKQVLFAQTQSGMLESMRRLPAAPGPEYGLTYDTLKAYLITTINHDRSTRNFLAPVLLSRWNAGRNPGGEQMQLAEKQFEFYSDELKIANPYAGENDGAAIDKARRYLALFAGFERVYQAILADAAKSGPPLNFNRQFPGSAEVVANAKDVAGPFRKAGWDFVKSAIRTPDRYFSGEQWVLGEQGAAQVDRVNLEQRLQSRYYVDFLEQWRGYLGAGSVVRYKDLKDASQKLTMLSSNLSPLLSMLCLASQNVAVDDPAVANVFQPVQAVVPPGCAERYIAPANQNYMNSLITLQASIEAAAEAPGNDAAVAQSMSNATAAKIAARQLSQTFRMDPEGHTDALVLKLLLDPITNAEALIRSAGPAELNAKGKALCGQMSAVWKKYPFNATATAQATVADVNAIFHKPDGALWTLYDTSLQKLLTRQGAQYQASPAGGSALTPGFVTFFNQAAALSEALYAGNTPDPHFAYSLKPLPSEGIPNIGVTLVIDGQTLTYSGGAAVSTPFTWQAAGPHDFKSTLKIGGQPADWLSGQGLWAAFHFFDQAERAVPAESGQILEWIIRAGRGPMTVDGKPVTVRFQLEMGNSPALFQKGFFSRMGCVADIAKP